MKFSDFRAECAKWNKGEPCDGSVKYLCDNAKKADPDGGYIKWQAAAWNASGYAKPKAK